MLGWISRFKPWSAFWLLCAALPSCAQTVLVADAHVSITRPTTNYGSISNLDVGGGYSALLRFDLSLLPADTKPEQIGRAVLRLYVNRVNTPGSVAMQTIAADWSESAVTFASLPAMNAAKTNIPVNSSDSFLAVDVTSLVQGWMRSPATNYGIAVTGVGGTDVQFDSKENDLTAHAAQLEINVPSGVGSVGPVGPAGAAGATGPVGPQGLTGPAGPQGIPGAAGEKGSDGKAGAQGVAGPQGIPGLQGPQGVAGVTGSTGPMGPQGPAGPQGAAGIQGAVGPMGPAGPQGLTGATGSQGPVGLTGATGPAGPQGVPGIAGPTGAMGPVGLTGPEGSPGLVYQGAYGPTTGYAKKDVVLWQGSSWLSLHDLNRGNTPSESSADWSMLASAGAQGPAGRDGAAGVAGPQGIPGIGAQGPAGPQGPRGETGANGAPGVVYKGAYQPITAYTHGDAVLWQGSSWISLADSNRGQTPDMSPDTWALLAQKGEVGAAGAVGMQGVQGQTGATGAKGDAGATGDRGPQGLKGDPGAPGMTFRGEFALATNYAQGDAVTHGGSLWLSKIDTNSGNTPQSSDFAWALLAQAGAKGEIGETGAAGPQGAPGIQGPQGIPGVAGAVGPQGIAGATGAIGINFTGAYDSTRSYVARDAVIWAGSTYISLAENNRGNVPAGSPAMWALLAQQGAVGLTGAQGADGAPGAPGPVGPQGQPGIAGPVGATGSSGPKGSPGLVYRGAYESGTGYLSGDVVYFAGSSYVSLADDNHTNTPPESPLQWGLLSQHGDAGAQGLPGTTGEQGPQGLPGVQGLRGETGQAGAIGPQGPAGPQGAAGPQGVAGERGPQGIQGVPGVGLSWKGTWAPSTGYARNDVVFYRGSTYLAVADNSLINPEGDTAGSYWSLLASAGADGVAGAIGPAGAQGLQGLTGPSGPQGPAGVQGAQGAVGAQGPQGLQGLTGPPGAAGPAGPQGQTGLTYRGSWLIATPYSANDVVTRGGSSYIARVASTGLDPLTDGEIHWNTLAAQGGTGVAGPSGTPGASASIVIGTVTTGAPGSQASVSNIGSSSAAVLNFTIPQGAAGASGSGGGGGAQVFSTVHTVTSANNFFAPWDNVANPTETGIVLGYVPQACTVSGLKIYSAVVPLGGGTLTVTLRSGTTPTTMSDSSMVCTFTTSGSTCNHAGSLNLQAGSFVDFRISGAGVSNQFLWTSFSCQ